MKQIEFIVTINQNAVKNAMVQNPDGTTDFNIIPGIVITHNYHKHDLITVKFQEFNEEYILQKDSDLKDIITLSKENNPYNAIYSFCSTALHKK